MLPQAPLDHAHIECSELRGCIGMARQNEDREA
jgi:hypothetical protein